MQHWVAYWTLHRREDIAMSLAGLAGKGQPGSVPPEAASDDSGSSSQSALFNRRASRCVLPRSGMLVWPSLREARLERTALMWVNAATSYGNILTCSRRERRRFAKASISILLLLLLASSASADAVRPTNASTELTLAPGVSSFLYLDGPWQFHVGLTHWVPGWSARGYSRYAGYAWYRLRIALSAVVECR